MNEKEEEIKKGDDVNLFRLNMILDEERAHYNKIDNSYTNNRNRMFILLSAELAVMTYLFSDITNMLPKELYGMIIFGIACAGVLSSVGLLFIFYRSIFNWPVPIGATDIEKLKQKETKEEILEYFIEDYIESREKAHEILTRDAKVLNLSTHMFIISAIILMVIKIF